MSFTNVNSNFSTFTDLDVAEDTNAIAGAGGTDLEAYSADDRTLLTELFNGPYTNASSTTAPKGIVDASDNTFGTGFQSGGNELDLAESAPEARQGTGGEILGVFYESRQQLLKRLAGNVENASSFPTPAGIVDTASDPFGTGFQNDNGERHLGHHVWGKATAPNGLPLEGTIQIEADGEPYESAVAAADFIISTAPLPPVTDGEDGDGIPTFDAVFIPKPDAVNSERENIGYPNGGELSATYGIVYGYVTGESGEPVQGANVAGDGAFTTTDSTGYYTLLAPGGRTVALQSVDGTATDDVPVEAGPDGTRKDWQFAGVEVRVLGPDYNPIEGAPVRIAGEVYRTDENGQVVLSSFPLGEYQLEVMDVHEETIDLTAEGALAKTTVQGGSRLKIRCYAQDSGDEVANVPAIDVESGTLSYSNGQGVVSLLTFDAAGFDVLVGEGDKRYLSEPVEANPDDGAVEEAEVVLEPQPAVTNR